MSGWGVKVGGSYAKSKKAVRTAVLAGEEVVLVKTWSYFGQTPYQGPVSQAPPGQYPIVGPDPERDRRFYGTVTVHPNGGVVVT